MTWREFDFVAIGVNVIAGVVLLGGIIGAIAGAPSIPDAGLPEAADWHGPEPPAEECDDCREGDERKDDEDDDREGGRYKGGKRGKD